MARHFLASETDALFQHIDEARWNDILWWEVGARMSRARAFAVLSDLEDDLRDGSEYAVGGIPLEPCVPMDTLQEAKTGFACPTWESLIDVLNTHY